MLSIVFNKKIVISIFALVQEKIKSSIIMIGYRLKNSVRYTS